MMWSLKREGVPLIILVMFAAIVLYAYPLLPDRMPTHFNMEGKPDAWMGKNAAILLDAGVMLGTYLLITFLPFIDPFWKKIEPKYGLILLFRDILLGFLAFFFLLAILGGPGGALNVNLFGVAVGLLFVVLGNYMPKLPRNWFVGIRTPWTITSEKVWRKTHIVGGWLFVLSGITLVLVALMHGPQAFALLSSAVVLVGFSYGYSFYLYKKFQKEEGPLSGKTESS